MSTLADDFLNDFNSEEFNDNEIEERNNLLHRDDDDEDEQEEEEGRQDEIMKDEPEVGDQEDLMLTDELLEKKQIELIKNLKDAPLESIATLKSSSKLKGIMDQIESLLKQPLPEKGKKSAQGTVEHQLIVDCNILVQQIQHEIYLIHKYVLEKYSAKYPGLESTIQNPLDYISVVKRIGNENDLVNINFNDLLPKSIIMVLLMSSGSGKNLSEQEVNKIISACDMALGLDENKRTILHYLESRMSFIAPNLSALLGSSIAARLIGIAGSVQALSVIPAGNLQTFGAANKALAGFSGITNKKFQNGLISQCDLVKSTPPYLQKQAIRMLTGKVSIAARVDSVQESYLDGEMGTKYKEDIMARVSQLQEPPPVKQVKALPAPVDKPGKKRGGRRARAYKQRYGMTELRKQQNRMSFGEEEKTIGDGEVGLGMIGGDSGRIRLLAQDRGILKRHKNQQQKEYSGGRSTVGGRQTSMAGNKTSATTTGGSLTMSGLQSVMITPSTGLQLGGNNALMSGTETSTNKYFGKDGIKRKSDQI